MTECAVATCGHAATLCVISTTHPHAIERMVGICGVEEVKLDIVGFVSQDPLFKLSTCIAAEAMSAVPQCHSAACAVAVAACQQSWLDRAATHRCVPQTVLFCPQWP